MGHGAGGGAKEGLKVNQKKNAGGRKTFLATERGKAEKKAMFHWRLEEKTAVTDPFLEKQKRKTRGTTQNTRGNDRVHTKEGSKKTVGVACAPSPSVVMD